MVDTGIAMSSIMATGSITNSCKSSAQISKLIESFTTVLVFLN